MLCAIFFDKCLKIRSYNVKIIYFDETKKVQIPSNALVLSGLSGSTVFTSVSMLTSCSCVFSIPNGTGGVTKTIVTQIMSGCLKVTYFEQ